MIFREIYAEALAETQLNFAYEWRGNYSANPTAPPLVAPKYDDDDFPLPAQDAQPVQETLAEVSSMIHVYRENGELKFGVPGSEIEL